MAKPIVTHHGGWIGVDLDGTLAVYDGWRGPDHIGAPVPAMVARVKKWRAAGIEVRIFTARIAPAGNQSAKEALPAIERQRDVIGAWCREHIGEYLTLTCVKDFGMVELWDDRAISVCPNTGVAIQAMHDPGAGVVSVYRP